LNALLQDVDSGESAEPNESPAVVTGEAELLARILTALLEGRPQKLALLQASNVTPVLVELDRCHACIEIVDARE
jgi:hypothetical protein